MAAIGAATMDRPMRDFSPEPPLESQPPTQGDPPKAAGGLAAAVSSLRVSLRQLGLVRTVEAWRRVNQVDGFDCPSCAWADSGGEHHTLDFCENGAKAFSDASSTQLCEAGFFAQHSVAEMAGRSDLWLNAQGRLAEPLYLAPTEDRYRPIAWPDAFRLIADGLRACPTPGRSCFLHQRQKPLMSRRSCFNCSRGASAPTTFPTARTCVMSLRGLRCGIARFGQGNRHG